ncbi:hypothetical protein EX30DRAFT_392512 [Ascodesmis nigricans]|uniref:Probable kinetochore protein NUF2 n=1 Tax=Ascodesmis nigricans TaxID=341454 RepID=A0A4S2N7G4_9PEZI|nr:hypothetical protein EX30DRAFT_392512 [Ascodesmis nigricans]
MSYNPRQSNMFPRSSQNMKTPASVSRKNQQKQSTFDSDLLISDSEILDCLRELGIPFSAEDLAQPTPMRVFSVFESFADQLMSVRKETVEPTVQGASEESDYPDGFYDSATFTVFFQELKTLTQECGVMDFELPDFLQPRPDRLKYILSCVINFLRYRTELNETIQKHADKGEEARERAEARMEENEMLKQRIMELRALREQEAPGVAQETKLNDRLTEDLRALKKTQTAVAEEIEKTRAEKKRIIRAFEEIREINLLNQREIETIQPYIVDSPEKLTHSITEFSGSVAHARGIVDATSLRERAINTTSSSAQLIEQDINACIKLMEECEKELLKLEETHRKSQRLAEMIHQKEEECKESDRAEERLSRTLAGSLEKIQHLRAHGEAKYGAMRQEQQAQEEEYTKIKKTQEETTNAIEISDQKVDIKQKEMTDIKEKIDEECRQARVQYDILASKITMYLTSMQQQMTRA